MSYLPELLSMNIKKGLKKNLLEYEYKLEKNAFGKSMVCLVLIKAVWIFRMFLNPLGSPLLISYRHLP
jgi:hypothetical protein